MALSFVAALALAIPSSPAVGGSPVATDLSYSVPIAGDWTYVAVNDGSEATFADSSGNMQLSVRCTRSSRTVRILKASTAASPSLWVWTSSQMKSLPATFDPSAARVSADLPANDPLLDAIASSRGRIGISTSGLAALVVPAWADVARVIEDCRV